MNKLGWLGHVLPMSSEGMLWCTLFCEAINGWNRGRYNQRQKIWELWLSGWDPWDLLKLWLETAGHLAASQSVAFLNSKHILFHIVIQIIIIIITNVIISLTEVAARQQPKPRHFEARWWLQKLTVFFPLIDCSSDAVKIIWQKLQEFAHESRVISWLQRKAWMLKHIDFPWTKIPFWSLFQTFKIARKCYQLRALITPYASLVRASPKHHLASAPFQSSKEPDRKDQLATEAV